MTKAHHARARGRGLAFAVSAAAAIGVGSVALAGQASAQRGYGRGDAPPYVVAESHWGKGTVAGAVRPGRHGWQVQMPGGTWIDCVRSCSETLRRATVDFWESNGPHAKDSGPGYFRWSF